MFTNLIELIKTLPDEQKCRDYVAEQRWGAGKVVCPYCGHNKAYRIEGGKRYKCAAKTCYQKFSVLVGTFMQDSNIPLTKWLTGIYLVTSSKKGISSYTLGRQLEIAQKNSWFMMHRIRQVLTDKTDVVLEGEVEIDETYLSKRFRSKYKGLPPDEVERLSQSGQYQNKGAAIGIIQRDGKAVIRAIDSINKANIGEIVKKHVNPDNTILYTDESNVYKYILRDYNRQTVCHSKGQWVDKACHVNTVEGLWSVMKRGLYGIYHRASKKHLDAYCREFEFRFNTRHITDSQRFVLSLGQLQGRLTYKDLIREKEGKEKDPRSYYRQNKPDSR